MNDRIHHAEGAEGVHEFESRRYPGVYYRSDGDTCECPARGMCWHKRVARIRNHKAKGGTLRQVAERVAHEDMDSEARLEAMHELRVMRGGAA